MRGKGSANGKETENARGNGKENVNVRGQAELETGTNSFIIKSLSLVRFVRISLFFTNTLSNTYL